eukprot:TRINITY_DN1156_c0_g1_i4.p1 TRINITY_DN1156_c0_g1~~TRINITY_DN1156_c0_g1_i4.p1  ORF type:complete len:756 (-),score=105.59 TRINITY_DN1156_c0_g1_i4:1163-3430(-)
MRRRKHLCWGCILSIIGTALLVTGLGGYFLINHQFAPTVIKNDLVISTNSINYPRWVSNVFDGAPELHQGFYLYNLTNPYDFLRGSKPIYQEIGPFVYREYHRKLNFSWSADQNQVSYLDYAHFVFDQSQSVMDPTTAVITNLNPAYMAVMNQAGSDLLFTIGFTGIVFEQYLEFLTTFFVDYVRMTFVPSVLQSAQANLVVGTGVTYFFEQWANATVLPSPKWEGMLLCVNMTTPSGISLDSASKLFDPLVYFSLMEESFESHSVWQWALYGDPDNCTALKQHFFLDDQQLNLILRWLNGSFSQYWLTPEIQANYSITDLKDIGWIQWAQGNITDGVSVKSLWPQRSDQFPIVPEYPLWYLSWESLGAETLPVDVAKQLLNGSAGIFDPVNMGAFVLAAKSLNFSNIEDTWGLNAEQVGEFMPYVLDNIYNASTYLLGQIFEEGGGLITNRTVHEILWNVTDPLLALVMPDLSNARLSVNYTSEADVFKNQNYSTCWTGKDDITKIFQLIVYEGVSNITGFPEVITISGSTEDGQFQPFLGDYTPIQVWNPQYIRELTLLPVASVTVEGLAAQRYMIDNATFMENPDYTNFIQGFVNLTALKQSPVFIGNPHMILADDIWREKIIGMAPPNPATDLTSVDLEPITGKVVQVNKSLQVNLYVPSDSYNYIFYTPGIQKGAMYPLMWAWQRAIITKPLADQLRDKLYLILKIQKYLLPVGVPIGGLFLLIGLFLSIPMGCFGWKFTRMQQYEVIND